MMAKNGSGIWSALSAVEQQKETDAFVPLYKQAAYQAKAHIGTIRSRLDLQSRILCGSGQQRGSAMVS
jgi:hypothetical protein